MTIGGLTESEEYLSSLCEQTFLSLWSFPNTFKNTAKELTDLLVIFGNDVIIFSDKSCVYKNTERLSIDWNRWYRKAVEKSAHQLYQAERWITSYPNKIFLDPRCKIPFPLNLPEPNKMRIHRIAIAHGAHKECISFYGGGSGSLRIGTDVTPIMASDEEFLKAFTVGHSDESKGCVHVFDDVTLDIVLKDPS